MARRSQLQRQGWKCVLQVFSLALTRCSLRRADATSGKRALLLFKQQQKNIPKGLTTSKICLASTLVQ